MSFINLLQLLSGDSQQTITDKINFNFDQVISMGGGPQGERGLRGEIGPIGPQGSTGIDGLAGKDGTTWFTGVDLDFPVIGVSVDDYYLDTASGVIYQYNGLTWDNRGTMLSSSNVFRQYQNNIIITTPANPNSTFKSLILSPIDYQASSLTSDAGSAMLKLVGATGPMMYFSQTDTTNASTGEITAGKQAYIQMEPKALGVQEYNFYLNNPSGSVIIHGDSNELFIGKNAAGDRHIYQFGDSGENARLSFNLDRVDSVRRIGYYGGSPDLIATKLHFGNHEGTARHLTLNGLGQLGLGTDSPTVQYTQVNSLGVPTIGNTQDWWHLTSQNNDSVTFKQARPENFVREIRLQGSSSYSTGTGSTSKHFLSFSYGDASRGSSLRMGTGNTVGNEFYFGVNDHRHAIFGNDAMVAEHTNVAGKSIGDNATLSVVSNVGISGVGKKRFGGIHMYSTDALTGAFAGISYGGHTESQKNSVNAQILFRSEDTGGNLGAGIEFKTTTYNISGEPPLRMFINQYGNVGIGISNISAIGNRLAVSGNVSIGADYINTPGPANGLIVQGQTLIGTTNTNIDTRLAVFGGVTIGSTQTAMDASVPLGGLLVEGNTGIGIGSHAFELGGTSWRLNINGNMRPDAVVFTKSANNPNNVKTITTITGANRVTGTLNQIHSYAQTLTPANGTVPVWTEPGGQAQIPGPSNGNFNLAKLADGTGIERWTFRETGVIPTWRNAPGENRLTSRNNTFQTYRFPEATGNVPLTSLYDHRHFYNPAVFIAYNQNGGSVVFSENLSGPPSGYNGYFRTYIVTLTGFIEYAETPPRISLGVIYLTIGGLGSSYIRATCGPSTESGLLHCTPFTVQSMVRLGIGETRLCEAFVDRIAASGNVMFRDIRMLIQGTPAI
jgi:hypothetical protein